MQDYPHIYKAGAGGGPGGEVTVTSPRLSAFPSTSPPEFGGPEGNWSPETLLIASVADCFVLTFRAVARASRFDWHELQCEAEGKLQKVERQLRFTDFYLRARLKVPAGARIELAEKLLQKAEAGCLITNSLSAELHLETRIEQAPDQRVA
jgi:organic hydroperoxide reductase OsmC/OhrA